MANVAASFLEIIAEEREESARRAPPPPVPRAPKEKLLRWLMGTAYACHPKRIADLPFLLWDTAADISRGGTKGPERRDDATAARHLRRRMPRHHPGAHHRRCASAAFFRGATSAR